MQYVAQVNADPEQHLRFRRHGLVVLGRAVLRRHREFDGVDRTAELGQRAISGQIDDSSPELPCQLHNCGLVLFQLLRCPTIIAPHKPRIPRDVDRNDGGEAASGRGGKRRIHKLPSSRGTYS